MKSWHRWGLLLLSSVLCFSIESSIKINSDYLRYSPDGSIIASGNVQIFGSEISLSAKQAFFDTKANHVYAVGDVSFNYKNRYFSSYQLDYDVENKQFQVYNLSSTLNIDEAATPIYFRSDVFKRLDNAYIGKGGCFTTCPPQKEYYTINAERFELYPNDKIAAFNVYGHSGPIPLFWSPYYEFQLGERNPIYLYPILGENNVEGAFVKNTLDYFINRDASSLLFIDYLERKGWGLGAKAVIYPKHPVSAKIYGYSVDSANYVMDARIDIKLTNNNSILYRHNRRDIYLLNGSREDYLKQKVGLENSVVGNMSYDENEDFRNNKKSQHYTWRKPIFGNNVFFDFAKNHFNQTSFENRIIQFRTTSKFLRQSLYYSMNDYVASNRQYEVIRENATFMLSPYHQAKINLNYNKNESNGLADTFLNPYFSLLYSASKDRGNQLKFISSVELKSDLKIDLDGETVTTDSNNYIKETLSELNLKFNRNSFGALYWTPDFSLGHYHERKYIGTLLDLYHHRMVLKNSFNWNPLKSKLLNIDTNFIYHQYVYSSGDMQYSLAGNAALHFFPGFFISDSISYKEAGFEGYTPFYFDEVRTYYKRINNEFRVNLVKGLMLKILDGINLDTNKRELERFYIDYKPDNFRSVNFSSGFDYDSMEWKNLENKLFIKSDKQNFLSIKNSFNLKKGELDSSSIKLGSVLGEHEPWTLSAEWVWNKTSESYRMPRIKVIKNLDCVEWSYEWNDYRKEYTFMFKITAFPSEAVGYSEGLEGIKVKGLDKDRKIR